MNLRVTEYGPKVQRNSLIAAVIVAEVPPTGSLVYHGVKRGGPSGAALFTRIVPALRDKVRR
jgi:hypothetical protein